MTCDGGGWFGGMGRDGDGWDKAESKGKGLLYGAALRRTGGFTRVVTVSLLRVSLLRGFWMIFVDGRMEGVV